MPLDENKFLDIWDEKTYEKAKKTLNDIASNSSKISWGINQLWRFFDNLQKSWIDNPTGISKIIKIYQEKTINDSEIRPFRSAWRKISHPHSAGSKEWELNPPKRND